MDELSSEAEASSQSSYGVSNMSSMVELDLQGEDGRDQTMQSLRAVPVRVRDFASAPSPRLDALQRNIDNCIGKNRPCSRDIQALLGISATVSGIGMIGLSPNAPLPYAWVIGSVGVPLFLAGATMVRYAAEKQ